MKYKDLYLEEKSKNEQVVAANSALIFAINIIEQKKTKLQSFRLFMKDMALISGIILAAFLLS